MRHNGPPSSINVPKHDLCGALGVAILAGLNNIEVICLRMRAQLYHVVVEVMSHSVA